ncbi:hypothetical protein [Natrinema sp. DC36]|uniref:hypothetical protein n=1 Tax=Natrinema sp. DC36 TaxID=2878680 RepID=UPI001CEFB3F0|nr:hypothetical protein [Natrinema sp. DC36]
MRDRQWLTRGYVNAIADAVEHANAHPSNSAREDYDMEYVVSEGYYPGDNTHEIDLSEIPEHLRQSAMIQAQSQLADRGLMVNSVAFEAATLHVVTANWLLERLPGMGAEHR